MVRRLKVVMLGNYPIYKFAKELGLSSTAAQRVTSWNETLAEALAELHDVEIHFITRCNARRTTTVQRGALTVTYLAGSKLLNAVTLYGYTAWKSKQIVRQMRADIVHGIGTEHIWPSAALMSGFPAVVTVHGIITNILKKLKLPFFSRQRLLFSWFAMLERRVMRKTKHLISISPYVLESLRQFVSAKVYCVENAVSPVFFEDPAMPASSRQILFVGDTDQRKALLTLLHAFVRVKEAGLTEGWRISVAGPVRTGSYYDSIVAYIEEKGLKDDIAFKGFMLPVTLAAEYRNSAFLVLSSVEETAPMCIAEAMAMGLPVVSTNVSGVPYMVTAGRTGFLCCVDQASEMAGYMEILMTNQLTRQEMGLAAMGVARERWHPKTIAEQTLEVYRSVLSAGS